MTCDLILYHLLLWHFAHERGLSVRAGSIGPTTVFPYAMRNLSACVTNIIRFSSVPVLKIDVWAIRPWQIFLCGTNPETNPKKRRPVTSRFLCIKSYISKKRLLHYVKHLAWLLIFQEYCRIHKSYPCLQDLWTFDTSIAKY